MARVKLTPVQITLLSLTVLLVLATILGLSIFFGASTRRRARAEKPASPASPTFPQYTGNDYVFDVNDNLKVCERRTKRIKLKDDVTDYFPRMNETIFELSAEGGGTLALDEGEYLLSRQLSIPSRVCLRGRGMDKTMLKMEPKSAPWRRAGMIRIQNAERVSLIDFTADGSNNTQDFNDDEAHYGRYGLYATSFRHLWIRGVRMSNHYAYGFDPHGTRDTWSHYLVIEGSVAEKNGLDGFTLDQTRHISLLDSVARDNFRHGVNIVTGSANVLVRRLVSQNNGEDPVRRNVGCGIIVQNNEPALQTRDCVLDANTIIEAPRAGVCVSDAVNITISRTNTTILRHPRAACYLLRGARQVVIRDSTCNAASGQRVNDDGDSQFLDDGGGRPGAGAGAGAGVGGRAALDTTGVPVPREDDAERPPDPWCKAGRMHKDVCCPEECAECGGAGCSARAGGPDCCAAAIRAGGVPCSAKGPPCVLSAAHIAPTPHVHISSRPGDDGDGAEPDVAVVAPPDSRPPSPAVTAVAILAPM